MKTNNLTTKESVYLLYTYVSISIFLVMIVSMVTKNIDNCEKTIDFHPIVSLVVVLNMVTLATFNYYKKNTIQRG
jgi:fumarate reductase subunit C